MMRGKVAPATRVRPVDFTPTERQKEAVRRQLAGQDLPGSTHEVDGAADPSAALPRHDTTGAQRASATTSSPRRRPQTIELPRPASPPPPNAVHSLNPEDARPFTRPLTIDEGLIRNVGVPEVTAEQIIRAIADPDDSWTADAGASDHFQQGRLTVQVRRADNTVIGAFTTAYALSVRPEEYERSLDAAIEAAGPSNRAGKGTRHPTTRRELMDRLRQAGFIIEHGSTHGRVHHPDHPGLFVPLASTPSDVRYTRHAVAQIRRVFGIDLRR